MGVRLWLSDRPRGSPCPSTLARCCRRSALCRNGLQAGSLPLCNSPEGGVRIASHSSNGPGANARRHAASEIEVHCELGSRVAVDS